MSESSEEPSSIEESSSAEQSLPEEESSPVEESSEELSSAESSSTESSEEAATGWELTYEDIPATTSGKYNIDFDFSNDEASFHGSYLQRGGGDKSGVSLAKTIQVKANKDGTNGYFYLTSGNAYHLTFAVLRIQTTYGDFTGTPTLYSAETMNETNGEEVTLSKTETTDEMNREVYLYEATLPYSSFRFENASSNAIFLSSFSCAYNAD